MPMLTMVRMPLAGSSGPLAAAHTIGESAHRVQNFVNVRDDVLTVDGQSRILGQTQCCVQYGAVFGSVDVIAREHRVASCLDAGLAGQFDE